MNIEQIEVIIGTDGRIRLETSGFTGEACLSATENIEALLGNQILQREQTAGSFERESVKTAEKIRVRS